MIMEMILADTQLCVGVLMAFVSIGMIPLMIRIRNFIASSFKEDETGLDLVKTLPADCKTVHLVVLVHGLQNTPWSLNALTSALREQAKAQNETAVLVHASSSNVGKTTQGILPCGERVAEEVNTLVDAILNRGSPPSKITISLYGNSLGGLMARAAVPHIQWQKPGTGTVIQPHLYCTTNSPHLGSRGTLIFPMPEMLQYIISVIYGTTMLDLFRYTNAMEELQSDEYIRPLGEFTKRIAYTSTHQTDFQVPTATGAFLTRTDSMHETVHEEYQDIPYVLQALNTVPAQEVQEPVPSKSMEDQEWVDYHGSRLDSLGWTKVFCDVRCTLYYLPIGWIQGWMGCSTLLPKHVPSPTNGHAMSGNGHTKDHWTSSRLFEVYCSHTPGRLYTPMAHTIVTGMLAGFWKSRTIVDGLATQMLKDVVEVGAEK